MSRKNLVLQLWAKTFFHNQILALFFYQYHLKQLINILDFCLVVTLNGRKHLRLVTLLVGCGQLCLSFSQIEGLFDHQYICKKSITTTDILHGDNHQKKEGSESTFFAWVLPVIPAVQPDWWILWSSISLGRMNWYCRFFTWRNNHQRKEGSESPTYGLMLLVVPLV